MFRLFWPLSSHLWVLVAVIFDTLSVISCVCVPIHKYTHVIFGVSVCVCVCVSVCVCMRECQSALVFQNDMFDCFVEQNLNIFSLQMRDKKYIREFVQRGPPTSKF
jgi:hypothetical protein